MRIAHLNMQGWGVGDYRHWVPARALRRAGHEVWDTPDEGASVNVDNLDELCFKLASDYDLIHMGFTTNLKMVEAVAAMRHYASTVLNKNLPILADVDDDLLHVPDYNLGFKAYQAGEVKRTALFHFRISDGLSVTTSWLKVLYEPTNDHISILPNCFDPSDWPSPVKPVHDDVRIVFAGGLGRKNDLDEIRGALESVMRQRANVRLFFMGMMPDWAQENWAADAADPHANRAFWIDPAAIKTYRRIMNHPYTAFDIALAPVVPNDFNRGKSDIKVLEAGLYGAAAVCSDWPTYMDVPKGCALKCSTETEWTESILALVDDVELRRKIAERCRTWALDTRTIDGNIHKWVAFYEDALSRPVIDAAGVGIKQAAIG